MLKINVTTLDSFRRFMNSDRDVETYIDELINRPEPGKYAILGTAFHQVLQDPYEAHKRAAINDLNGFLSPAKIYFEFETVNKALKHIDRMFPFEMKFNKVYYVDGHEVMISGIVDQLKGKTVIEHKTIWTDYRNGKMRSLYDEFRSSVQWPFYLDMTGSTGIIYKLFRLQEDDEKMQIELKSIDEIGFTRGDTEINLEQVIREFLGFLHTYNLESYFKMSKGYVIEPIGV